MSRWELRAVFNVEELPEEWQEDIRQDVEWTLSEYKGYGIIVELKEDAA